MSEHTPGTTAKMIANNARACRDCQLRQRQAGCDGRCKGCWKEAHGIARNSRLTRIRKALLWHWYWTSAPAGR